MKKQIEIEGWTFVPDSIPGMWIVYRPDGGIAGKRGLRMAVFMALGRLPTQRELDGSS